MLKSAIIIVSCTVLALSSALPRHQWHWSRPDFPKFKAHANEWHWSKPATDGHNHAVVTPSLAHTVNGGRLQSAPTVAIQSTSVIVKDGDVCGSVIANLVKDNERNITRFVHVCQNDKSEPGEDNVDIIGMPTFSNTV